jgi:O-antigen/teichoic acid export membrane protein
MEMATLLIGFAGLFSELGLGAAIIQREKVTRDELSSNFWLSIFLGIALTIVGFVVAYPTAWIFNEPRLIPISQLLSCSFVIGALMIVPYNLLTREYKFKEIGIINLSAALISSCSMLLMAKAGYGVWTLAWGVIILRSITVILVFLVSKWKPDLHFRFADIKPFLRYGLNIMGTRSLYYFHQKIDKFIVAKILGIEALGYYSLALELASTPRDKIVSVVNQVAFPVFSQLQNNTEKIREVYLRIIKHLSLIMAPFLLIGAFFGREIILVVLGEKWLPIAVLFSAFCITELIISLTSINGIVLNAQGRPHWVLWLSMLSTMLMAISTYAASQYGLNALAIPWIVVYPSIAIAFTWITFRKIEMTLPRYVEALRPALLVSLAMCILLYAGHYMNLVRYLNLNIQRSFVLEISIGLAFYLGYLLLFERNNILEMWSVLRPDISKKLTAADAS